MCVQSNGERLVGLATGFSTILLAVASLLRGLARDGQPHYPMREFPSFTKPQQAPKTPEDRVMCWQKLYKMRERLYNVGLVLSLMHMFYMPKGDSDIRMVYNGAALGINECLFAPHFGLPVILYVLRSLRPGYYQADMDIGKMFPNFILGEQLCPYSGVDVTHICTTAEDLPHHLPTPSRKYRIGRSITLGSGRDGLRTGWA